MKLLPHFPERSHPDCARMATPAMRSISNTAFNLGIGRTSVFNLIKIGKLNIVKFGRKSLVLQDSIDTYIAELRAEMQQRRISDAVLSERRLPQIAKRRGRPSRRADQQLAQAQEDPSLGRWGRLGTPTEEVCELRWERT